MAKKVYKISKLNIFEYKTNQKDEIFANSKLNKQGFPEIYPTRDSLNHAVFISFVDAQIMSLADGTISEEKATFDILDTDKFNPNDPDAAIKTKFLSALLSLKYRVVGGVYVRGQFYTGKMEKHYASKLSKAFMEKFFCIEDRKYIEENFDRNAAGVFPYWPTTSKELKDKIVFSAVNASIKDIKTGQVIAENLNFNLVQGRLFDLRNPEDKQKADLIFALIDPSKYVDGFYYRGGLIGKINQSRKLYYEKSFIKNNFSTKPSDIEYLKKVATLDKDGNLLFYPAHDEQGHRVVVSFRNGKVPFGEEYSNFDIRTDLDFDPNNIENQNKIQIIEGMINKKPEYSGALYLDSILIPGKENEVEIERRKAKVEKDLEVRIDGDPDYLAIFTKFTTDDREALILMCDFFREAYPKGHKIVPKLIKGDTNFLIFDKVNILDNDGKFAFKEDYSAKYELAEGYKPTQEEILIFKNMFKKHSLVRGGVYHLGKNINRNKKVGVFNKELASYFDAEDAAEIAKSASQVGCVYKMDPRSGMLLHWPTFDRNGKEVVLSVVDADVWFKVSKTTVKAANDMNFDIYRGETFGLVGESGSGKTTISRAILGINKLRKGGIYWKGKLISSGLNKKESKATKKSIQMIFQDPAACLNERANVDYIVSEGLYNFKLFKDNEERLLKVTKMLRSVGLLPEHLSRYPHEFSGGQRQRIGIARALIIEPELVLADEPISALDVSIRAQVLNLLKQLQNEKQLTYLFIAHDLSIIRYISDRIAVMHNGFIVEIGSAEEIYGNPLHPYTQALLTAIPQPDPKSKNKRKKEVYEQGDIVYSECVYKEYVPGHQVLVNEKLDKMISEKLK